ncbi:DUF4440 domain-containing protein [Pseudochrobactrum kiredjianiae]|uniref:DUF4440 domain-containing protein n=1 Tax=Pseudochrobactrum kiredjianiae TaxID=386305 RepID=A0ABW3V0Z1_9HYPH|nr:DUF4440 domain-containing protein [Pseudochrobactrum kiredjianiae]MDM7852606.1 DUF4440 domain-containing protein [Pseudochrobactrum kiredjianiae]
MPNTNIYFDLIKHTHDLIENWFSGSDTANTIYEQLIADFSPDFTMITLGGKELDYANLCSFFKAQSGAKPALKITLHNMTTIYENNDSAVITYQETQEQPQKPPHRRFSTVIVSKDPNGKPLWRHLHETTAAS